jgi:uncharacterized cupin superfamily protein
MTAALVLYRSAGAPVSTVFRQAGLGNDDPFASWREIAWEGSGAMSAGRLRFEGTLDISSFPHIESLVVVEGELIVETAGAASLVLAAGSGVVIGAGTALRVKSAFSALVVFCAAACQQPMQHGLLPLRAEANFKPSSGSLPPEILLGPVPQCRSDNVFNEEAVKYLAGTWDSTPYHRIVRPHPVNEFMYILDGGVRFAAPDGSVLSVEAGDAIFVPQGAAIGWESSERVAKFYVVQNVPASIEEK